MANDYYPPGASAEQYEEWAGTDFDGEPTCDICGEELDDNGDCLECEDDEESEDTE